MSRHWLPIALFLLCGLLVALEFWAFGELSSTKSNALDCWPNCTTYQDGIRYLAIVGLPAVILGTAIAAFVSLWRSSRR